MILKKFSIFTYNWKATILTMINKFATNSSLVARIVCYCIVAISPLLINAQTYNDGPMELRVRMREINTTFAETDIAFFGIVGTPDDLTYKVWGRDNADIDALGWLGGLCLTDNFSPPGQSVDFNYSLLNFTYPTATVPRFFDLRMDSWEDESPDQLLGIGCGGTRCNYDVNFCCGGFLFGLCVGAWDDDDYRCNANPFLTGLDYRAAGPPCRWNEHGTPLYVIGNCPSNNYYQPRIQSYWRYLNGDDCATPIVMGNVAPGFTALTNYNSTECYTNVFTPGTTDNDVFYQFTVTNPVGLDINLCAGTSFTPRLTLLDNTCTPIMTNTLGCAGAFARIQTAICTPGVYYVVVDGASPGQRGWFNLEIAEDPSQIVNVNAGPDQLICIGTAVQVGGIPAAVGGPPAYTYNWTPGTLVNDSTIANPFAFPLVQTDFILTVTDGNGCQDSDTMTVFVQPGPAVNLGPDQTVCPRDTVTLDAGGPFIGYFWSTGANTQTVDITQPGLYFVSVININGCWGQDTIIISNYPQPNINIGPDSNICAGTVHILDAGAPGWINYLWDNGGIGPTRAVNAAGVYWVRAQDGNGCYAYDTITIGVVANPTPNIGPDQFICPGDLATFDPGPGFVIYNWTTGGNNQTETLGTTGPIAVTVTDVNGCLGSDNANVTLFPQPVANLGPDRSICPGNTTVLNPGIFAGYQWNTGATTQTITVQFPGMYYVEVTSGNGCTDIDTIIVTYDPLPNVNLGADRESCQGTPVNLNAGPGFASYLWSTGAGTQSINVNTTGLYWVQVTNGFGCTDRDSINVTINPNPTPNLGPDVSICPGDSVQLNGGNGYVNYAWTNGATGQYIFVDVAGNIGLTVTDANGCTGTDNLLVSLYPAPSVNLGPDFNFCQGTNTTLDAGAGFASYLWNTGAITQTINVSFPGYYAVAVTDANGCTAYDNITVGWDALPVANLGSDRGICAGSNTLLDPGAGFASYTWNTGAVTPTLSVNTAGVYWVDVTNAAGCLDRDSITITVNPLPVVALGPDFSICPGDSALLDAGPGFVSYVWSNGASGQFQFVNAAGVYSVTVTDVNGCTANDAVTVGLFSNPTVNLGPNTNICVGNTILLDAGAGFSQYNWNTGATTQTLTVTLPGIYAVTVTNANGCEASDTVIVGQFPQPVINLGNDTTLCGGGLLPLVAQGGFISYLWNTGSTAQNIIATLGGTYWVEGTDANGCIARDTIVIISVPNPVVVLNNQQICANETALIDAGPGFASYVWNTGSNSQFIQTNVPGNYSVVVTDQFGCTGTDNMSLTVFANPIVNLGPDPQVCQGGSIILDAGAGFTGYAWSNGATSQTISVSFPGQYFVVITDGNGCEDSDTVNVTFFPEPLVNIGPDVTLCDGVAHTFNGPPAMTSYNWSTGGTGQNETITPIAAGSISLTVTDANGCTNTDQADITLSPAVTVNLGNDTTICDQGSLMLDAGPNMANYNWGPGGGNDQYLFVSTPGTYTVTITNQYGCTGMDAITIQTSSVISGNFLGADTTFCDGTVLILDAGANFATYLWANGSPDQYLAVTTSGNYSVEATDTNGCRFLDDVTVSVQTIPILNLGPSQDLCPGSSISLDAGAGWNTYLWSTGETTQTVEVSTPGIVSVMATFGLCSDEDDIDITDICPGRIFIPNVFSPNADGMNDIYAVDGENIEFVHIWIYDRWGNLIHEATDPDNLWNGNSKSGKAIPEGVYIYRIEYKFNNSEVTEEDKGTITLMR